MFLYSWWIYFKYLLIIFISLSVSSCMFFYWDALLNFLGNKVVAFEFFFFLMQNSLALSLILICFSLHVFTLFYFFLPPASTSQSKSLSSVRKLLKLYIVEGIHIQEDGVDITLTLLWRTKQGKRLGRSLNN